MNKFVSRSLATLAFILVCASGVFLLLSLSSNSDEHAPTAYYFGITAGAVLSGCLSWVARAVFLKVIPKDLPNNSK